MKLKEKTGKKPKAGRNARAQCRAMISTAAARPLPAAFAPQQVASSAACAVSAPASPASAPQAVTVPSSQPVNSITVQLSPALKASEWTWSDPSIWTPIVAFLAIASSQWITWRQLRTQRRGTEAQLAETRANTEMQLAAAAANTDKQLAAARETAERQMQNARDQATLDRTLESRKDIFSQFIDDFKNTAQLIGDLPNRNLLDGGAVVEELSAMNATVNKVWLWAEPRTVYEVRAMQTEINELFFDAIMECRSIYRVLANIKRAQARVSELEADRSRVIETIRNSQAEETDHEFQTASSMAAEKAHGALKRIQEGIKVGREELVNLHTESSRLRSLYMQFIGSRQPQLMDHLNELMKLARKELQVSGDTTALDIQTEEIKKRMQEAVQRVRDAVK